MATPADLPERVRSLRAGTLIPVPPRPAATVALIRDGDRGLEVYLLRRVPQMSFAAGMYVFPGGSVDPADAGIPTEPDSDGEVEWPGPGLFVAAVRETFEECGVLLAGPSTTELVDDASGPDWEAERERLEARGQSLAELLDRRRLLLRADLLAPIAHWITPEVEPKRFDTWFFAAALPAGQHAREAGSEADARLWVRPADALSSGLRLMPPTVAVLTDLSAHDDVSSALAAVRPLPTVMPHAELTGNEVRFVV